MDKTALLIIDMQNAVYTDGGQTPYNGETVLANIQNLLERARQKGLPVVYIQHTDSEELREGTPGWQICPSIVPASGESRVQKSTWDAFHQTRLQAVLEEMGVKRLILAGMQTEFCLDTTCRRAFSLGYQSVLVSDAHTTFDSPALSGKQIVDHHNRVLGGRFAVLKTTRQALLEI